MVSGGRKPRNEGESQDYSTVFMTANAVNKSVKLLRSSVLFTRFPLECPPMAELTIIEEMVLKMRQGHTRTAQPIQGRSVSRTKDKNLKDGPPPVSTYKKKPLHRQNKPIPKPKPIAHREIHAGPFTEVIEHIKGVRASSLGGLPRPLVLNK